MVRTGTIGYLPKLVFLLCVVYAALGYNWDVERTEVVVGAETPTTIYNFSSPINRSFTEEELKLCDELLGRRVTLGGRLIFTPANYNVLEILTNLGGRPGEVTPSWTNKNAPDAPLTNTEDRPLKDAPRQNWLYEYNATDYKSYIRLEHGTRRFTGTPKEFIDVRGILVWTPEDFCGKMRLAFYRQDDTGFTPQVRQTLIEFRNDSKILAIRHAPVCFKTPEKTNCF